MIRSICEFMNMIAQPIPLVVSSAYRQLQAVERNFVDKYVQEIERRADKAGAIINVFGRTIPADLYGASRGLLDRQIVLAAINERLNDLADATDVSPKRILREISAIAFFNMAKFTRIVQSPDGQSVERVIDFAQATDEDMKAVKEFTVEELPRGGRKMKFGGYDKLKALGELMTYTGMREPNNEHWQEQQARNKANERVLTGIAADATDQEAGDRWADWLENNA